MLTRFPANPKSETYRKLLISNWRHLGDIQGAFSGAYSDRPEYAGLAVGLFVSPSECRNVVDHVEKDPLQNAADQLASNRYVAEVRVVALDFSTPRWSVLMPT